MKRIIGLAGDDNVAKARRAFLAPRLEICSLTRSASMSSLSLLVPFSFHDDICLSVLSVVLWTCFLLKCLSS